MIAYNVEIVARCQAARPSGRGPGLSGFARPAGYGASNTSLTDLPVQFEGAVMLSTARMVAAVSVVRMLREIAPRRITRGPAMIHGIVRSVLAVVPWTFWAPPWSDVRMIVVPSGR